MVSLAFARFLAFFSHLFITVWSSNGGVVVATAVAAAAAVVVAGTRILNPFSLTFLTNDARMLVLLPSNHALNVMDLALLTFRCLCAR